MKMLQMFTASNNSPPGLPRRSSIILLAPFSFKATTAFFTSLPASGVKSVNWTKPTLLLTIPKYGTLLIFIFSLLNSNLIGWSTPIRFTISVTDVPTWPRIRWFASSCVIFDKSTSSIFSTSSPIFNPFLKAGYPSYTSVTTVLFPISRVTAPMPPYCPVFNVR